MNTATSMTISSPGDELPGTSYWRHAAAATVASVHEAFSRQSIVPNVTAGITVALVALPLNIALALACGLPAVVGLVTGAVAGLLGAFLGGARLQVTGPEVALAPISFEIVSRYGFEGLVVAVAMAGAIQIAFGLLRVGRMIHVIPMPVIVGFLAAVAILVFDTQIPVFLGVSSEARLVPQLTLDILRRVPWSTVLVGTIVVVAMVTLPKLSRRVPAPLVGLVLAMVAVAAFGLSVPTVEPLEGGWPAPSLPRFSAVDLGAILPEAVALALLASIDSLLCAVSIDARMPGARTRTDQELVAQGVANLGSACFGGMPVAAAIVRSAAAHEAGATTRMAPIVQSMVLAVVVLAFASLLAYIPLSALAAVLLVVGWRLIDWRRISRMWSVARFEVVVFGATAAGIVFTDFVMGVIIGVVVALAHFAHRQRKLMRTTSLGVESYRGDVRIVRFEGPIFFASQAKIEALLDHVMEHRGRLVLDFDAVPVLDSSGVIALNRALERLLRAGNHVWLCALGEEWTALLREFSDIPVDRLRLSSSVEAALGDITHLQGAQNVA